MAIQESSLYYEYDSWFRANPTWRGDKDFSENVKKFLNEQQLNMFKEGFFGKFMELPEFFLPGKMLHCFLLCALKSQSTESLRFYVRGHYYEFTPNDFSEITGLKTSPSPTALRDSQKATSYLVDTYFSKDRGLTISCLKKFIKNNKGNVQNDRDAVKLAEAYVLANIFCGGRGDKVIPKSLLQLIEDDDSYSNAAFGDYIFVATIASIRLKLEERINPNKQYKLEGFPHAICYWIVRCFQSLFSNHFIDLGVDKVPFMLRYEIKGTLKYDTVARELDPTKPPVLCAYGSTSKIPASPLCPEKVMSTPNDGRSAVLSSDLNRKLDKILSNQRSMPKEQNLIIEQQKRMKERQELTKRDLRTLTFEVNLFSDTVDAFIRSASRRTDAAAVELNNEPACTSVDFVEAEADDVDLSSFRPHHLTKKFENVSVDVEPTTRTTHHSDAELIYSGLSSLGDLGAGVGSGGANNAAEKVGVTEGADLVSPPGENHPISVRADFTTPITIESPKDDENLSILSVYCRKRKRGDSGPVTDDDAGLMKVEMDKRLGKPSWFVLSPCYKFHGKKSKPHSDWKDHYRRQCPFHYTRTRTYRYAFGDFIRSKEDKIRNLTGKVKAQDLYGEKDDSLNVAYNLYNVQIKRRSWFLELSHIKYDLEDEHLDVMLYYIKKKVLYHNLIGGKRFSTANLTFDRAVKEIATKSVGVSEDEKFVFIQNNYDLFFSVIYGLNADFPSRCGISWEVADMVIMPWRLGSKTHGRQSTHYLLGVFHIDEKRIDIYDSIFDEGHRSVMEHAEFYASLLPEILKFLGFNHQRPSYGDKYEKLTYRWIKCPLQRNIIESGVYTALFAGMVMAGTDVTKEKKINMKEFRVNMAINLWCHAQKKIDDGYDTPPENVGDDYHDHNYVEGACNCPSDLLKPL